MAEKELDFGGIINLNADGDKATSLIIGVYQKNASLAVFSNKKMIARFPFPRTFISMFKHKLEGVMKAAPGTKVNCVFSKYDNDTKKSSGIGNMIIGKDDKSIMYLGIQAPNHPNMKFLMKTPLSFDLSDPMSDADRSLVAAQTIVDQLTIDIPNAISATSFKRDAGGFSSGGGSSSGSDSIF